MRQKKPWPLLRKLSIDRSQVLKVLLIGFLVTAAVIINSVFRVKKISCSFGAEPCPDSLVTILDNYKNKSILLLKKKQLESDIMSVGLSQAVAIKIMMPSTLVISAVPQTQTHQFLGIFSLDAPSFSFMISTDSAQLTPPSQEINDFIASQSGKTFEVTSNGTALEKTVETQNVLITKALPDRDNLVRIFHWLDAFTSSPFDIKKIYFVDHLIILKTGNLPDVVLQIINDPVSSLKTLQAMVSLSTISSTKVIDFRFNHPILR